MLLTKKMGGYANLAFPIKSCLGYTPGIKYVYLLEEGRCFALRNESLQSNYALLMQQNIEIEYMLPLLHPNWSAAF